MPDENWHHGITDFTGKMLEKPRPLHLLERGKILHHGITEIAKKMVEFSLGQTLTLMSLMADNNFG